MEQDDRMLKPIPPLFKESEGRRVIWLTGITAIALFISSSVRHALFQSNAFDLGIMDQAVYLISQGQPAISSFLEFHILADHAAFIFYPIALLYKIYPDVHWLLAVQAIALSLGAIPIWYLARLAGLAPALALATSTAYLLYPLIFNLNLFDFHPDIPALPAMFAAILFARQRKVGWFCVAVALVLCCKEVFGLTIAAMGVWLLLERRLLYGAIALVGGSVWFWFATQVVIPYFGTPSASVDRQLGRFSQLGGSVPEIALNLVLKPQLFLGQIFTGDNLFYLFLLLIPVIWGLHWRHLLPLVGAIPQLAINLLSRQGVMKDLLHQYSLPILPFLFVAVISALAVGKAWFKSKRMIILWSLVAFFALGKVGYFWTRYLKEFDTWQATRAAIAQVPPQTTLLTTSRMAPHLTHRPTVRLAWEAYHGFDMNALPKFETILLNVRHPGYMGTPELTNDIIQKLMTDARFELQFQQDGVYLFSQKQGKTSDK